MKSKLAELDKQRESLLSALGILDEIDSGVIRNKTSSKQPEATDGTLIDTVLNILRDQSMTTNDLYDCVTPDRETSKASVHTALYRLRKRGKIFKEGKLWKLVEPTSSIEPQPQPLAISLRRSGVRDSVRAFPPRLARSRLKAGLSCLNDCAVVLDLSGRYAPDVNGARYVTWWSPFVVRSSSHKESLALLQIRHNGPE